MRFIDLSQPFPEHSPDPLLPFAHLRDLAISSCLVNALVSALVLSVNQVEGAYLYLCSALLFLNGIAGYLALRVASIDTFGFRVWSSVSQTVGVCLLTVTAYFVLSPVSAFVATALIAIPFLASVSLALWLMLFKQVQRRPARIDSMSLTLGPVFGVALASIPALTTGSIVSGLGYFLVASMTFVAVLQLLFDLRALVWFYRASPRHA